ncbi:hypothetical protein GTW78_19450 [Streptomyces sp. SID4948]|nr:hypothetical protein [Streptomyces sp. SID4948]
MSATLSAALSAALSTALNGTSPQRFASTVLRLHANACDICGQFADSLLAGVAAGDWSAARLVALLDGLAAGPDGGGEAAEAGRPAGDRRTAPAARSPRARLLAGLSAPQLADVAAHLWSADGQEEAVPPPPPPGKGPAPPPPPPGGSPGPPRPAPGSKRPRSWNGWPGRPPRAPCSTSPRAWPATDRPNWPSSCWKRPPAPGPPRISPTCWNSPERIRTPPETGGLLRTAVVRRRPPAFLAELLRLLERRGGPAADLLLTAAAADGTVRDVARTLLILRHSGGPAAAMAQAVADLVVQLPVAAVAEALVLLDRYADGEAVDTLMARALRADSEAVADLIHRLSELGHPRLVAAAVEHVVAVTRADQVLHLFILLHDRGLRDEAAGVLHGTVAQVRPASLSESLDLFRSTRRPGAEQLNRVLGVVATSCTVEQAYELALWARSRTADGGQVVAAAVAETWPVPRMEELARRFTDTAYPGLAKQLFRLAVADFGERRADGAEIAELILALQRRPDAAQEWRKSIRELIGRLAERRDTQQIMALVGRLLAAHQYAALRDAVEGAVLAAFGWEEFVWLPQVHGATYLPAVLEIELRALLSPECLPDRRVPSVVQALKDAGARHEDMRQLLGYVGRRRRIDSTDVITSLRTAGLDEEADAFTDGSVRRRPVFLAS